MLKLITLLAAAFFTSASLDVDHESQVFAARQSAGTYIAGTAGSFFKSLPKFCQ